MKKIIVVNKKNVSGKLPLVTKFNPDAFMDEIDKKLEKAARKNKK